MRIAVWHNLPSGGGKRALYYHIKGLVERGHQVEVWCPSSADLSFLPLSEFAVEHVLPFEWTARKGQSRYGRYFEDYRNVNSLIRALDEHARQVSREIAGRTFDLLFANTCAFFFAPFIGRYITLPRILFLQEPHRPLYEAMPSLPWTALPVEGERAFAHYKNLVVDLVRTQARRIQAREERLNAESFDAILVNSYYSRESVLRAYGLDARVCYLGIDTNKFEYRSLPRERWLVGLGAFVGSKNIGFVIRAVAKLKEPRPRLLWIGNAAYDKFLFELKELARSLGVDFEARVRIDDDELVEVLNRAAMLVYAPRLEPFGFAPLEANACGSPVVGVAEGGVRETLLDGVNGLVVEPEAQAMAEAIERLLCDTEYARRLGENGRRIVEERWSLNAANERLEQHLKKVAGRGNTNSGAKDG